MKYLEFAELDLACGCVLEEGHAMSNKEVVIDLLERLPADSSLQVIAREIEFLAGISEAREQSARREGTSAEKARTLVNHWAGL